jgi:hypothetical protein
VAAQFVGEVKVIPGIRRAILSEYRHYQGSSKDPHAELHYSGSGFAATNKMALVPEVRKPTNLPDQIYQDGLEIAVFELLLMLAHHAVECGASGECVLRAQLHPSQQTGPLDLPVATEVYEPAGDYYGDPTMSKYQSVRDSLVLKGAQTHPTYASASLGELVSNLSTAVVTAYALAADILAEFGVSEPSILGPDGTINAGRLIDYRRQVYEPWAGAHGLLPGQPN